MRIRLSIPDDIGDPERKEALDAALEAVTICAADQVRTGKVPTADRAIADGIKWKPEPPGDEHFDLPSTVMQRGNGDCDDLAPYWAGTLRATGKDPKARAIVKKSGPTRWHAIVRRGDGSIDDPSKAAGMGSGVNGDGHHVVGAGPAMHSPITDGRMCLAICPSRDPRHAALWFARLDVPDIGEPWGWSATSAHADPAAAIVRSIKGVRAVAGPELDAADDARLACMHDLICGVEPELVAEVLDEVAGDVLDVDGCVNDAIVGIGFFKGISRGVKKGFRKIAPIAKVIAPFAQAGLSFVPGLSAIAPTLQAAQHGAALARGIHAAARGRRGRARPGARGTRAISFGPETWTFGLEPGVVNFPLGVNGPAVLRF
jgi:hypothetical protein